MAAKDNLSASEIDKTSFWYGGLCAICHPGGGFTEFDRDGELYYDVVTNQFEPLNPFANGRGPRRIKFTRLPPDATIRIFTVSGRLLKTLRRDYGDNDGLPRDPYEAEFLLDGTLDWDLQSDDGLGVSYGVYLYHVSAPGIGEKTGTFAIIK